jgi:hypothetical protein
MKYTSRTTIGGRIRVSCIRSRQQQKLSVLSLASIVLLVELMILLGSTDIVTIYPVVDAFRTSSYQSSSRSNIPSSSLLLTPRGTTTIVKTTSTNNLLLLFSSVGDGDGGSRSGGGRSSDDDNDLGDFLDPMKKPDSEGMKRARQYMSETSLPISFGDDGIDEIGSEHNDDIDHEKDDDRNSDVVEENKDDDLMSTYNEDEDNNNTAILNVTSSSSSSDTENTDDSTELSSSSSLVSSRGNATSSALFGGSGAGGSDNNGDDDDNNKSQQQITGPSPSLLAKNPYMQVVSKISPSDLIAKFTAESDPRVQEAVRTTILGLIGSLPKLAFETTSITTGQRLASLVRTYARKNILDYLSIFHIVVNIMELSIFLMHFCFLSCASFGVMDVYNIWFCFRLHKYRCFNFK